MYLWPFMTTRYCAKVWLLPELAFIVAHLGEAFSHFNPNRVKNMVGGKGYIKRWCVPGGVIVVFSHLCGYAMWTRYKPNSKVMLNETPIPAIPFIPWQAKWEHVFGVRSIEVVCSPRFVANVSQRQLMEHFELVTSTQTGYLYHLVSVASTDFH